MLNQRKFHSTFYSITAVFLLLAAGIGGVAYWYYSVHRLRVAEETERKLSALAAIKVDQISRWRHERLADAYIIIDTPFIAPLVEQCFQINAGDYPSPLPEVLEWMKSHKDRYDYHSVSLLDPGGTVRFSFPEGIEAGKELQNVLLALQQRESPIFCDLDRSEAGRDIFMNLFAPFLILKEGVPTPVGYLQLQIDPHRFLYPLVQSWPIPSATAETMLVRREGDEVLVLNDLRFRQDTSFSMHLSIRELNIPAALQEQAYEGISYSTDYRGASVVAAVKQVPGTSWYLIAKIDMAEIFAPLHARALTLSLLLTLLICGAGATVGLIWSYQRSQLYLKQYRTEAERLEIAQRYQYLTSQANDIILLLKPDGTIAEANQRALNTYGYEINKLVGAGIKSLEEPGSPSAFDLCRQQALERDGCVFETAHRRLDGASFPVEISARLVKPGAGKFYLLIIRDITERKLAESALKEAHDTLEQRIRDRTADLQAVNEKLSREIEIRRRAEGELRSLTVRLAEMEEAERRRLSRELHDRVGQNLTALNFNITATMNLLAAGPDSEAVNRLQDSQKLVEETVTCVRDVMADLRPPLLDDFGLAAVLRWYCREFSQRSGIPADSDCQRYTHRLPLSVELALFRIAQESLTNVMRHSRAKKVTVELETLDGSVRMSIYDDGVGFIPRSAHSPLGQQSGWGMVSMRERAEMVCGSLQVDSVPGGGTRITVEVMKAPCQ